MGFTSYQLPDDVIENDNEYLVRAVVWADPEQLEITFENNTLTIKGEIKEENKDEQQGRYHIRERYAGSFYRRYRRSWTD